MSSIINPKSYFFDQAGLNKKVATDVLKTSLYGMDDGELFLERNIMETVAWRKQRVISATHESFQGFGLRSVTGDKVGYAFSNSFDEKYLKEAGAAVKTVQGDQINIFSLSPEHHANDSLYADKNPIDPKDFKTKVMLLDDIDRYVRSNSPYVIDVGVGLNVSNQLVNIIRPDGFFAYDLRPLVGLSVVVQTEINSIIQRGFSSIGARTSYEEICDPGVWQFLADEALRISLLKHKAKPAPAGNMPVVLGGGGTATFIHEAIGHGAEADFNRRKTSLYSNLLGKKVASSGVNIIEGGNIEQKGHGSFKIDDEGTESTKTVLVENGKLVNYLQNRQNARLLGMKPTGNARRQDLRFLPIPRMTTTVMQGGKYHTQEMIESVKRGVYIESISSGQVNITTGNFVFYLEEAYMIENGRLTYPLKEALITGKGPKSLSNIEMIGSEVIMSPEPSYCGKDGQTVPIGYGMPSVLISSMTVGGIAL